MDGAQGMELACACREMFGGTLVVWITDAPYFVRVAIRMHIFDFIVRPFAEAQFRESVRKLKEGKVDVWQKMPSGRRMGHWKEKVPDKISACL
ncbi:MAG: hypothetical protein K2M46_03575 [Lachnospiraceae bacterium]|nr:hypothetical protein [Lachnospiraceae bacterium]